MIKFKPGNPILLQPKGETETYLAFVMESDFS